ncbi:Protein kinase DC2 [Leucoagaricus sp. SymC.cos]|nr:Protein kinase DC2 [Leucoagaricus sp. SymC.cos]
MSHKAAPITPPHSPGHSESSDDDDYLLDDDMNGDDEECTDSQEGSQLAQPLTPAQSDFNGMHVDAHPSSDRPQPPLRLLENERVHLQSTGPGGIRLSDFEVRGTLGTGTFGHVLLVRHKSPQPESTQLFAMKVLRKTKISMLHQVEHVKAERYILARVHHPFVVDLFATFQDGLNIYMLMSYVPGGELFTHLRRAQRFTSDVTRFYLSTIVLAIRYLHSFNIIYRDLKPENLLLDSRGYLRLTDFGFAKVVDDRTWTLCGTPEYLAPEVIQSDGHGKAADWWACGVLCYEMLVGYPPFFDETPYGIYEKILVGNVYWPRTLDRLSRDLIRGFLNPDRSKRLGNVNNGVQDVLQHSWFRGVDWDALERREINAPIIPRASSAEDAGNFLNLPIPPAEDIPGFFQDDATVAAQIRSDMLSYHFPDF